MKTKLLSYGNLTRWSHLSNKKICFRTLFVLKVLTVFFLALGATLIQMRCKAVFGVHKSLDDDIGTRVIFELCKKVLAHFLQEDQYELCKKVLAWFLQYYKRRANPILRMRIIII